MESGSSMPHSQGLSNNPYPEWNQPIQYFFYLKRRPRGRPKKYTELEKVCKNEKGQLETRTRKYRWKSRDGWRFLSNSTLISLETT